MLAVGLRFRPIYFIAAISVFLAGALLALPALAQENVVPERRLSMTRNMDFFAADLRPRLDISLRSCEKTCLGDAQCGAFTYNVKASACFLKSQVLERRPFDGALSAQVFVTDPAVLQMQAARLKSLAFLPKAFFSEARQQAVDLARNYLSNEWSAEQLVTASRKATTEGKTLRAMKLMAASLNLTDAPDSWAEMARLALKIKPNGYKQRRSLQKIVTSAAVNAYLRARKPALEVSALNILARGVEDRRQGRLSINILRLAQSISPRPDTEKALARAVALFGFRITENKVDNNTADPRICVVFSENLVPAGVDYADYVRLFETGLAVESDANQICVNGVRHGQRYRLTFRAGLPAASGEKLAKSIDINAYVRDRDPSARFVGRAYVLPRGKVASIPIVTVNLNEVDLKIDRVDARNLVQLFQKKLFGKPLSFWDEKDLKNQIGAPVWSGKGLVRNDLNKDVATALPVGDAIAKFKPGVYVMRARVPGADPTETSASAQWFVVTDLGLATMSGADGLHVFVRSLNTTLPKLGTKVRLVAVNNTILGVASADAKGYAHFSPGLLKGKGGNMPRIVTAELGNDFAFISLSDGAFDLSDRGVEGRVSPPPIDVFLTTDRGAYRAGETVYATALARDDRAGALVNLPLSAVIKRPDGVEFSRKLLADQGAGGHVFALPLPKTAQRGTWSIRIYADPKASALATGKFLVEDFTPERIDFTLALPDGALRIGDVPVLDLSARYLYGAPAGDLNVEAETRVSLADGIKGYPGYSFGRFDQKFPARQRFNSGKIKTNAAGFVRFGLTMPDVGDAVSRPLKMRALIRVREGSGRPVERVIEKALAPKTMLIGIKPLFDGVVAEGGNARFAVLAVGPDLKQHPLARVGWSLNRVKTRYQWYQSYGNWRYDPVTTRTRVANGEVELSATGAVQIEAAVDWGRYELKLETLSGDYVTASQAFYAGWYASAASSSTPDTLDIGLDKARYKIGETARLRLVPRYAGTALITVMSNRLIDMKTVKVKKGENLIDLKVTESWGAGAYVSATVIRPMDTAGGHNPARALGLNWASVDPGDHRLRAKFTSGDQVSPRRKMAATLQVKGVRDGETAYATIAAVDVGILNLTAFGAPDPDAHYFGQRKLGMELRDIYGRLIDSSEGSPGQIRSGGDSPVADRIQRPPTKEKLVAFFSGPLKVGADGQVSADFDIPAFNGTIRLMAVVWSKTGVGQASKDVLARDPIVVSASLPRFLAPHDKSRLLLELAHASGPSGKVGISITASGGLSIDTSGVAQSVILADKQKISLEIPITAPASGVSQITVALTTPGGKQLLKTLTLPIRANDPEIARSSQVDLANGATFTLTSDVFSGLLPGTGRATLAIGPIARFDAAGLLDALDRYPYGCSEQITSKALPLLYFQDVATALGLGARENINKRIDQAIAEVLSNQSASGAFGLWAPGSGDLWLDSYVSDFLSRARTKGFVVPRQAFRLAMDNLRNRINYAQDFEKGGEGIAYALMVLAREGGANIGDLRYYADTKVKAFATPLALAQLGAALAYYGDQMRADAMFRAAGRRLDLARDKKEKQVWRTDYGTNLRDTAAVLTLALEVGSKALDSQALARRVAPERLLDRARSTQENMWSLLAANALIENTRPGDFLVDGKPATGPVVQVLDARKGPVGTVRVTNKSGKSAVTVLTTYGVPGESEPAGGNGYTIERRYYSMAGASVNLDNVALNERFVVVIRVVPDGYSGARLIVSDPLPAGFEIDNPDLLKSGDIKALDWLNLTDKANHKEFRFDRFVAAIDWSSKKPFQLAYIMRAISPGRFHQPAASVQDMYRPEFRARTTAGQVVIR